MLHATSYRPRLRSPSAPTAHVAVTRRGEGGHSFAIRIPQAPRHLERASAARARRRPRRAPGATPNAPASTARVTVSLAGCGGRQPLRCSASRVGSITTARLEPERAGERAAERRPERDAHQQRAARVALHFTSRGGMGHQIRVRPRQVAVPAGVYGRTVALIRILHCTPAPRQTPAGSKLRRSWRDDRAARGEGRRDRKRHTQGG